MEIWPAKPKRLRSCTLTAWPRLAMSEAYAMTGDKRLEPTVQKAINYTLEHKSGRPAAGAIERSKNRRSAATPANSAGN